MQRDHWEHQRALFASLGEDNRCNKVSSRFSIQPESSSKLWYPSPARADMWVDGKSGRMIKSLVLSSQYKVNGRKEELIMGAGWWITVLSGSQERLYLHSNLQQQGGSEVCEAAAKWHVSILIERKKRLEWSRIHTLRHILYIEMAQQKRSMQEIYHISLIIAKLHL